MRARLRRFSLLVVFLNVFPPTPARAAQDPGAGGHGMLVQKAEANWVVDQKGEKLLFYYAQAYRYTNPIGAVNTIAVVGKGRCHSETRESDFVVRCLGVGRIRFIRPSQFKFDRLADSASLELERGRSTDVVRWEATHAARPVIENAAGQKQATAVVGLSRRATASGRVLGLRLGAERVQASMSEGVQAGTLVELRKAARGAGSRWVHGATFRGVLPK